MTLWTALAALAAACPEQVARAEVALLDAKEEHKEAFELVHSTNWDYYLSMGDRDQTLAEMDAADQRLHDAKVSVREAKRGYRSALTAVSSSERVCTPAELEAARSITNSPSPAL